MVDDLPMMRQAIRETLESAGYSVAEAENGREGVRGFLALSPILVLMDIVMPVMDGLEATRLIMRKFPKARIVMCSSMGQDKYLVAAIRYGARDFVVKPFSRERLLSAVGKALGR